MTGLLWNLLLALAWAAVTGDFGLPNITVGFVLGFVILLFTRRVVGSGYTHRVWLGAGLLAYFGWELILANARVAVDVLTPRHRARPGVIAVPLDVRSDTEITLLANLITLTPGTVSLDISPDRHTLYIHAMYIEGDDFDAVRRRIKDGFERRIIEVSR